MGGLLNQMKPIFAKRVSYSVKECKFSFYNMNTLFASGNVEQARGMHQIYANKESKTDIDVEKISLYNHLDQDEAGNPIVVLSPYGKRSEQTNDNFGMHVREAMFKLRTRDKFVVVSQAPWRVFDQYEIFIYPAAVVLTREFYRNIKQFIFDGAQADPVNEPGELQDHYEMLIQTKALHKAIPAAAESRDNATQIIQDNLSSNSKEKKMKLKFGEDTTTTK